jgi:Lipoma HMGIC fusion partner-like protein.
MVLAGVVVYPMGWDNKEVRESCGNLSHFYKLGEY